jgi:hypothetical protein
MGIRLWKMRDRRWASAHLRPVLPAQRRCAFAGLVVVEEHEDGADEDDLITSVLLSVASDPYCAMNAGIERPDWNWKRRQSAFSLVAIAFIWTKSARDILQNVIRANSRLSSKQNGRNQF